MELKVTVTKCCYRKEESGWSIIATDKGTCKGIIHWEPGTGDLLILNGDYQKYQGIKEFSFTSALQDIPIDPKSQLELVCERTPKMGEAMKEKIWEIYGDDWRKLEMDKIPRMNPRLFTEFKMVLEKLEMNKLQSDSIAFLMSKGCSPKFAAAAWNLFEDKTIGKITADPFELTKIPHYGFKDVDNGVRQNFGIKNNDPRRIDAAIFYSIKMLGEGGGHTVVEWKDLLSTTQSYTGGLIGELIKQQIKSMVDDGTLHVFKETKRFCLGINFMRAEEIWNYFK